MKSQQTHTGDAAADFDCQSQSADTTCESDTYVDNIFGSEKNM